MARTYLGALLAVTAAIALPGAAHAAVITNGTIELGVDQFGQLGTEGVGIQDSRTGFEAIFPGCVCEGWAVGDSGSGAWGGANNSQGIFNLSLVSFVPTASTATSIANVTGADLTVTHSFVTSATPDLYRVDVSITNTGTDAISDLLYRRVMDWDVEPTPFSEFVTIQGWPASALTGSSDNGFNSINPFTSLSQIVPGTLNTNFVDSGPADHGAAFDFNFGTLLAGETQTFSIFYGASLSEADALAALGLVGAEIYSFGQSNDNVDGNTERRATFIFGFKGVGGTPVGEVPEPSTWAMMLLGFGAAGFSIRRSKAARKRLPQAA